METNERIFMLVDIMLKRCEQLEDFDFIINLNKSYDGSSGENLLESYEMSIATAPDDDIFGGSNSLMMSFYFGEDDILPYISLNYTDDWQNVIKIFDKSILLKYKERIEKIYNESLSRQFDTLLLRCEEHFDITQEEVRDLKIEKIIKESYE